MNSPPCLCHVFCGGAAVDELVQRGCDNANGVAAIARGLQKQRGGSPPIDGRRHLCLCKCILELDSFYKRCTDDFF